MSDEAKSSRAERAEAIREIERLLGDGVTFGSAVVWGEIAHRLEGSLRLKDLVSILYRVKCCTQRAYDEGFEKGVRHKPPTESGR